MKNRVLVLLFVIVSIGSLNTQKISAQLFSGIQDEWIELTSYNGYESINYYNSWIVINGNNINYPEWSLSVRLGKSMTNAEGKTIDPSKVKVRFNKFESHGVRKTIAGMNADRSAIALSLDDRFIIRHSNEPLYHGNDDYYSRYLFYFDIIIEGGSYLEDLLSNNPEDANDLQYPFHLIFSVLDANDNILIQSSVENQIKINPQDTPPSGPDFGFEVHADATLNFTAPEHYTKRVENELSNSWVNVTSKNSGYVISVKASNPNFDLIENNSGVEGDSTIPVKMVNVKIDEGSSGYGKTTGAKSLSSTAAQTLFRGNKNKEPQKLPVRYFINKANAEKLATKSPGVYTTTLMYTLAPQ